MICWKLRPLVGCDAEGGRRGFPQKSRLFLQNSEYDSFLNACNFLFICAPKIFSCCRTSCRLRPNGMLLYHQGAFVQSVPASPHPSYAYSATKRLVNIGYKNYNNFIFKNSKKGILQRVDRRSIGKPPLAARNCVRCDTDLATFCVPVSRQY